MDTRDAGTLARAGRAVARWPWENAAFATGGLSWFFASAQRDDFPAALFAARVIWYNHERRSQEYHTHYTHASGNWIVRRWMAGWISGPFSIRR